MKNITFGKQMIIGLLFDLVMFICSTLFKNGLFSNIGFIVYGLMFVINPVFPKKAKDVKNIKLWIRLAGIVVMIIGIIIRFEV